MPILQQNSLLVVAGIFLLSVGQEGCTPADGMMPVSGAVQFDGQPIVYGEVFFKPDESKGHTGPQGFALIKNGNFDTESTGQGVIAGPHLVQLTGYSAPPVSSEDENNPPPTAEPIFSGYTVPVILDGTRLNLIVPAEARKPLVVAPKKRSK